MPHTIIFYDIPANIPGVSWSPSTWKTRYSLNFKGIPYKTVWVECPDIAPTCKKIGAPPTGKNPDGSPLYTLPAIYDPSTGTAISESTDIAKYLDMTYPDTPKLFLSGSHALQRNFLDVYFKPRSMTFLQFTMPAVYPILNPCSQEFFRRTKEPLFGMTLEDLTPKGKNREEQWAKLKEEFSAVDSWLCNEKGPYIMGSSLSFLDFFIASHLLSMKILFGEDSAEWSDLRVWNKGRWAKLLEDVRQYERIA